MRGSVAKRLKRGARELLPPDAPERQYVELIQRYGTRRQRDFVIPAKFVTKPKYWPEGKEWVDPSTPSKKVSILTYTVINHPNSIRGRYRLLKRAYMRIAHGRA